MDVINKKEIKLIIIFNAIYTIFTIKRQALQLHAGPFHRVIKLLNILRLFANFRSSGRQFRIRGPKDLRLFVPKVT